MKKEKWFTNETIHKVETQWHYPRMIKYGFKPITKEAIGFVHSYVYKKGSR